MQPFDARLLTLRDWLPGRVLLGGHGGQYHLRELVGEGGQGWVFSAGWDEPGGYMVIVKVLRPDAASPESLGRFEREAQVLRMLGQAPRPNPHIVRFFDHATAQLVAPWGGEPIHLPFTVLEYVRGPTLEHILEKGRGVGLALDRIRRIGRQIVLALEDVHARKIVHRDLKPSNVLLATEGDAEVAKVTDFGLVKLVDVGLGRTTALAGATLGYAPPEQFEQGNRRVGPRTDVFSFAAMLFEMLTGAKAFPHGEGENPLVVVTRLLNGPRPSLRQARGVIPRELSMRPDLVERLDALIGRASSAEPSERHGSIAELWGAIDSILRAAAERPAPSESPVAAPDIPTALDLPTTPPPPRGAVGAFAVGRPGQPVDASALRSKTSPEGHLARTAAWRWQVRVPALGAGAVRAAMFEPAGEAAIAASTSGFLWWEGSGWTRPAGASKVDVRHVRGMAWLFPREPLVFGAHGLAARVVAGRGVETWALPDPQVTFHGAHVDPQGTVVTLVGERPAQAGLGGAPNAPTVAVVAQFARGRLTLLADVPGCARLHAVTRFRAGEIVACGDSGALVRVELGVPQLMGSICSGHLYAIAPLLDGAVTVGAGGHALSLTSRLQAQLEAVQTTRDLLALAVDPSGTVWAGSAQARLLRRTAGSWVRMTAELGLSSSVLALNAGPRIVRAVCDDGAIIEGVLEEEHVDRGK